jgi:general stress protein YciG
MKCPKCKTKIPESLIAAELGRKGGKTKGANKARTSEQASKAARARWDKAKKNL